MRQGSDKHVQYYKHSKSTSLSNINLLHAECVLYLQDSEDTKHNVVSNAPVGFLSTRRPIEVILQILLNSGN